MPIYWNLHNIFLDAIFTPYFGTLLKARRLKVPSVCSITLCSPENCDSSTCLNRQRHPWDIQCTEGLEKFEESPLLKVERTADGIGVFSTGAITKGSNIVEYCGELVPLEIFQHRVSNIYSGLADVYGMPVRNSIVIDATRMGNISRHISFSSNHNANMHVAYETFGLPRAIIYLTRDILPHEEIKLPLSVNGINIKVCEHINTWIFMYFIHYDFFMQPKFTNTTKDIQIQNLKKCSMLPFVLNDVVRVVNSSIII